MKPVQLAFCFNSLVGYKKRSHVSPLLEVYGFCKIAKVSIEKQLGEETIGEYRFWFVTLAVRLEI
jgi:hypothetical protein